MNAYIYYKLDSETEYDLVVASEYFEKIGWDVQTNGLNLLVTTDESERKVDGMGDDGLYFDAVLEDLKPLIAKLNKDIDIAATVDTSEVAGEMMDYLVSSVDGQLKIKRSDWYLETCMRSYVDYKDFCDKFCDCSEEEYAEIKDCEFVYLLETDDGEILSGEVPMYEVKI